MSAPNAFSVTHRASDVIPCLTASSRPPFLSNPGIIPAYRTSVRCLGHDCRNGIWSRDQVWSLAWLSLLQTRVDSDQPDVPFDRLNPPSPYNTIDHRYSSGSLSSSSLAS